MAGTRHRHADDYQRPPVLNDLARLGGDLRRLWCVTSFGDPQLDRYAEAIMLGETRRGLLALGLISLVLMSAMAVVYSALGSGSHYVYTYGLLGGLSLAVFVAGTRLRELRALQLMGVTLLVLMGTALVLLAHQAGTFTPALFASVLLLFMAVPMVPWGLREAGLVTALIYLVFTTSTLTKVGRFPGDTLIMLQLYMLASCAISLVAVVRMVGVRKDDLAARFDLEESHRHMERLSYSDPLTGAWNRRYLTLRFDGLVEHHAESGRQSWFVLLDVDRFKRINDTLGHDAGDRVLQDLVENFSAVLRDDELLVRMGGDEFALVLQGLHPGTRLATVARATRERVGPDGQPGSVTLSLGLTRVDPDLPHDLDTVYRRADEAAYAAKKAGGDRMTELSVDEAMRAAAGDMH